MIKIINLKEKLQDFYYHNIYNPVYNFIDHIKNLIYWIPKVWNDEDYDYTTIYRLLYYKFNHMEQFYRDDKKTMSANNLKTAHQIIICKNLAKRLAEEDYIVNSTIEYDKKYGDKNLFDFIPDTYDKNGKAVLYTMKDRNRQQSEDFHRCSKLSDYLENQDREYLFNYLMKNIRNWWD